MAGSSVMPEKVTGRMDPAWRAKSPSALRPVSVAYGWLTRARNLLYDHQVFKTLWLDVPVISVGNLTTGGTGKTPTVIYVAELLQAMGYMPGVVLRGYGAKRGEFSDEELLLRQQLAAVPIVANPDRPAAARRAVGQSAQVLIADDAFQHRRLGRDLNICLIDATCPFGYEAMLPAGRLRERPEELRRADLVIVTRSDQVAAQALDEVCRRIGRYCPGSPILTSSHLPRELVDLDGFSTELTYLHDRAVVAFAGIGRPESFYESLSRLGARVVDRVSFADHHDYSGQDLSDLEDRRRRSGAELLVCTSKDVVKLDPRVLMSAGVDPRRISALSIAIRFSSDDERVLRSMLRERIEGFGRCIAERSWISGSAS